MRAKAQGLPFPSHFKVGMCALQAASHGGRVQHDSVHIPHVKGKRPVGSYDRLVPLLRPRCFWDPCCLCSPKGKGWLYWNARLAPPPPPLRLFALAGCVSCSQ